MYEIEKLVPATGPGPNAGLESLPIRMLSPIGSETCMILWLASSGTPGTIRALLQRMPRDLLHADEGEGTFSPFSVLGHLIQGEIHDWIPRVRWTLEHGRERAYPPFDRFAHIERIRGRSLEDLLTEFETPVTSRRYAT